MHALNLCDYQVTFAEEVPNLQLVRARPSAQNTARKIDRRERKLGQERSCNVDLPPPRLNLHNAPDDQVADFWVVASSKGMYREKFVGFLDGAGDGRDDRRGKGGYVSAVASCIVSLLFELSSKADCSAERTNLIHCGSSVTTSPGVTISVPIFAPPKRGRLLGREASAGPSSTPPSESIDMESTSESARGVPTSSTTGGRIVIAILLISTPGQAGEFQDDRVKSARLRDIKKESANKANSMPREGAYPTRSSTLLLERTKDLAGSLHVILYRLKAWWN